MNLPESIDSFIRTIMPKMEGWCQHDKAASLARQILNDSPSLCVEIGVFAGRSLIVAALALRELGGDRRIIGIDPWSASASNEGWSDANDPDCANRRWWGNCNHDRIYQQCLDYVRSLGLANHVELLRMTNREALPIVASRAPVDMLHIDGNHSEETSLFDVENYVPLCRDGAAVWFDDMDWGTTKPAQARLSELCEPVVLVGNCGLYRKMRLDSIVPAC